MADDEEEIKARIERLENEVQDYSRAVEEELNSLNELLGELTGLKNELSRLKSDLEHRSHDEIEDAIAVLNEELSTKKKRLDGIIKGEQYLNELMYLKADFENYKRRVAKEKREFADYTLECFISNLLPIKDSLDAALEHARKGDNNGGLTKGVEMTVKRFDEILRQIGLEEIKAEGELFDPFRHEVVSREERDTDPENKVIEVVRKGYVFHDKVLRPAMVKIAVKKTDRVAGGNEV